MRLDKQTKSIPEKVEFCKVCVISNQRPRIGWNKGVCGACDFVKIKNNTNWKEREEELRRLCDKHRNKDGDFDIIVPVSGGKDSARVAWELKNEYGMNPLTITWGPFEYTPIGYENFREFIKTGGFTNIMGWPNGKVHKKLSRIAFEALGDAWQPFTYGQVHFAFHIAKAFKIRLVFFGENGEAEYSGDPRVFDKKGMPIELWNEQYFKGTTVKDLISWGEENTDWFGKEDYTEQDLKFYGPTTKSEEGWMGEFHWFSYYKKWVPQENYYLAAENTGFKANPDGRSEGTHSKYASLDDQMDSYHYYLAFIKFGIGRCTSDAAHEIRDGHINREEGVALVKKYDGEFPKKYYKEFLEYLGINEEQFWEVVNSYRRPNIWKRVNNEWRLRNTVYDDERGLSEEPVYISSILEGRMFANKLPKGMSEEDWK